MANPRLHDPSLRLAAPARTTGALFFSLRVRRRFLAVPQAFLRAPFKARFLRYVKLTLDK
jgi:hypothetical protein